MKIVITGPKCSGKSRIGKLLSESVSLPFFETDEIIEQLFMKEKGKPLSCRAICAEYGEDFFRDYERRAIKQVAEYDFCMVSTGGSALLHKESRELLRENSVLVLLYASVSNLLERLSKKDIPDFLNDRNSRDLFAVRASLVIETLKPFADIVIDSSKMDMNKTLTVLISKLRNISRLSCAEYLNSKSSVLLSLGQIKPTKFLFSLNEKLIVMSGVVKKDFDYSGLYGITVKKEELFGYGKSWISFFSVNTDKKWMELVTDIHKKYFIGTARKKTDVLSPLLAGVLASNVLRNSGIEINAVFTSRGEKQTENIRGLSIEINIAGKHNRRRIEFFSAISTFFLSTVDIKLGFNENEQKLPVAGEVLSFNLISPTPKEKKVLVEIVNLYCALIIFSVIY